MQHRVPAGSNGQGQWFDTRARDLDLPQGGRAAPSVRGGRGVRRDRDGGAALARGGAAVPRTAGDDAVAVDARAPPRWSDRRECPAWRANSLENIVPENLPRPSARRRFNNISAPDRALAPEAVAPFLAPHSGLGCFSR